MPREIQGVLPIAHMPFTPDDEIDRDSLARQIDFAFDQGASGFCTGMVSEILRLTSEERLRLPHLLVELAAGRGVVVSSVGAESTKQAVLYAREAQRAGCDALMAIPPTTTALPDGQLIDYFETEAEFDILKSRPAYFRAEDHQLIQEAYPFTVKEMGTYSDVLDMIVLGEAVPAPGENLETIYPSTEDGGCKL